ncbi:hypothetical protein DPMN_075730 [Dreissena polymorpha]|uniref:Uncharacterized protein n=1 Tax=Dreissena polymorpha TaxID=45954 RepID=A0A9D3YLN7_DREPO|nr:hypothetical protein DPMN_075730 [Dreissena polymorpha]
MRRCRTLSKTDGAPSRVSETVCDDAKTVWAHAGNSKTVCDGARQSPRPAEHQQETPRQTATMPIPLGYMH